MPPAAEATAASGHRRAPGRQARPRQAARERPRKSERDGAGRAPCRDQGSGSRGVGRQGREASMMGSGERSVSKCPG